jgi:hypothetical protein
MVEYKRRFGCTGMKDGTDVTEDWELDMTPGMGVPILLDPRLNNNIALMGLDEKNKSDYMELLHNAHQEFYLVQRANHLQVMAEAHAQQQLLQELEIAAGEAGASNPLMQKPLDDNNIREFDMGFEADSDDEVAAAPSLTPSRIVPPPPSLPLIGSSRSLTFAPNPEYSTKTTRKPAGP